MVAEDPCRLVNADITREEVVQALLGRLKQKAAPGRDGLSTEMVCCDVLVDFWWSLFNWCWRNGMTPSEWRKNVIVPVPKKRRSGACVVDDFRGIALVSVVYKAMCSIVHQRMTQVVEEKQLLAEEQGGFRKGRGCRDQVLTLTLLGQIKAMSRRGMFAAFIDFRKAYMIEWIGVNCGSLEGMGFSGRVIGFIRAAYEGLIYQTAWYCYLCRDGGGCLYTVIQRKSSTILLNRCKNWRKALPMRKVDCTVSRANLACEHRCAVV